MVSLFQNNKHFTQNLVFFTRPKWRGHIYYKNCSCKHGITVFGYQISDDDDLQVDDGVMAMSPRRDCSPIDGLMRPDPQERRWSVGTPASQLSPGMKAPALGMSAVNVSAAIT